MALVFGLLIKCPNQEAGFQALWQYFDNLEFDLTSGLKVRWKLTKYNAHIVIDSTDLGMTGVDSFQTAVNMSEAGIRLCRRLLDAPDFIFADIGLNVDLDLERDFINEGIPTRDIIVSEAFYDQLKEKPHLDEFRKGYYWRPFTGIDLPVIMAPQYEPVRRLYDDLPPNLYLQGWLGQKSKFGRA